MIILRNCVVLSIVCCLSSCATFTEVVMNVKVPETTPENKQVYICGNHDELGNWEEGKVKTIKKDENHWIFTGRFKPGTILEYKYNLGSWENVEKTSDGGEVENRRVTVKGNKMELDDEVKAWSEGSKKLQHTITGSVDIIEEFESKILKNKRKVMVWLPPSYKKGTKRYPVLYMHDGQNVFDEAGSFMGVEWQADEAADRLIKEGKSRELIIVAVDNMEDKRPYEYTPYKEKKGGGGGHLYGKFLVTELKPYIDDKYRTLKDRENTGICGSSLGGLISLYLGFEYHDVFSALGVVSPYFGKEQGEIYDYVKEKKLVSAALTRICIDMGTAEGDFKEGEVSNMVLNSRRMNDTLKKKEVEVKYTEYEGAVHNEGAWQKRFPEVLEYLFPI